MTPWFFFFRFLYSTQFIKVAIGKLSQSIAASCITHVQQLNKVCQQLLQIPSYDHDQF